MKRNLMLKAALVAGLSINMAAHAASAVIEVYKSATCGCCEAWVKHLRDAGFTVNARNVDNPSDYREKYLIPNDLGSCHTAIVNGYAIEGHVPAADIKRLLTEKPKARGLAVPGMPLGSPGMEGPRNDSYDVLLVKQDSQHTVYKRYN